MADAAPTVTDFSVAHSIIIKMILKGIEEMNPAIRDKIVRSAIDMAKDADPNVQEVIRRVTT